MRGAVLNAEEQLTSTHSLVTVSTLLVDDIYIFLNNKKHKKIVVIRNIQACKCTVKVYICVESHQIHFYIQLTVAKTT